MVSEDTIFGLKSRLGITGDIIICSTSPNTRKGDWVLGQVSTSLQPASISFFPNCMEKDAISKFDSKSKIFGIVVENFPSSISAVQTSGKIGQHIERVKALIDSGPGEVYLSLENTGEMSKRNVGDQRGVFVKLGTVSDGFLNIEIRVGLT